MSRERFKVPGVVKRDFINLIRADGSLEEAVEILKPNIKPNLTKTDINELTNQLRVIKWNFRRKFKRCGSNTKKFLEISEDFLEGPISLPLKFKNVKDLIPSPTSYKHQDNDVYVKFRGACNYCFVCSMNLPLDWSLNLTKRLAKSLVLILNLSSTKTVNFELNLVDCRLCSVCYDKVVEVNDIGRELEQLLSSAKVLSEEIDKLLQVGISNHPEIRQPVHGVENGYMSPEELRKEIINARSTPIERTESLPKPNPVMSHYNTRPRKLKPVAPLCSKNEIIDNNYREFIHFDHYNVQVEENPLSHSKPTEEMEHESEQNFENVEDKDNKVIRTRLMSRKQRIIENKKQKLSMRAKMVKLKAQKQKSIIRTNSSPFSDKEIQILLSEYKNHTTVLEGKNLSEHPEPDVWGVWAEVAKAVSERSGKKRTVYSCWRELQKRVLHSQNDVFVTVPTAESSFKGTHDIMPVRCEVSTVGMNTKGSEMSSAQLRTAYSLLRAKARQRQSLHKKQVQRNNVIQRQQAIPKPRTKSQLRKQIFEEKSDDILQRLHCTHRGCISNTFKDSIRLDAHIQRVHLGSKQPFRCTVEGCDKAFSKRRYLGYHLTIHTGGENIKKYSCTECPKKFLEGYLLKRHVITSHNPLPPEHQCNKCLIRFHTTQLLAQHLRVKHAPKDSFPCSVEFCTMIYSSKLSLEKHQSRHHWEQFPHLKEKFTLNHTHVCIECGKVYQTQKCFDSHMMAHRGFVKEKKIPLSRTQLFV